MLLPCNSEEYEEAKNYTALQAKKVGARQLKEGTTYVTKSEENLVYLGRHMWYEEKDRHRSGDSHRDGQKFHIFCNAADGKNARPIKSVPSVIAAVLNEHPHDETANWIDAYLQKNTNSAEIIEWIREPIPDEEWNQDWEKKTNRWDRTSISCFREVPNIKGAFYKVSIQKYQRGYGYRPHDCNLPDSCLVYTRHQILRPDGSSGYISSGNSGYYSSRSMQDPGEGQVQDRSEFFRLKVKYANGIVKKWG